MKLKIQRKHLNVLIVFLQRIQTLDDYTIIVQFENGEERVKDIKNLLDKAAFKPIVDIKVFKSAIVVDGAITQILSDGQEIDLCPDKTYETSKPIMSVNLSP